jgi:hypothetical protein
MEATGVYWKPVTRTRGRLKASREVLVKALRGSVSAAPAHAPTRQPPPQWT